MIDPRVQDKRAGSALIAVLALAVVMALLVAEFGHMLRGDLRAESTYYTSAQTYQLARSGVALATMEMQRTKAYTNNYGQVYFLSADSNYEETIDDIQVYRDGYTLGAGRVAYEFLVKTSALDLSELSSTQWHRLLEVGCEMESGDERSALVDCAVDWIDQDAMQRPLGAEADAYEDMSPPRYIRNSQPDSTEELLLVNGFTRAILFGTDVPLREENNMLFGGGIYRYIQGDNSPEGIASQKYIMSGVTATDALNDSLDSDEITYGKLRRLPTELYLIARGFIPAEGAEDDDEDAAEPTAEHVILVKLNYVKDGYMITEWQDHADRQTIERLTRYGLSNATDL